MDDNKAVPVVQDGEYIGSNLPVTRADFDALSDQRKMLLEFVAKQLRKEVDYGVIPGTPKPSLYKPGAEKLSRLFGLGIKLAMTDKTIDKTQNFAMFTYKAEIIHLKSGQLISECEASCNSQEKKYKERTTWAENPQTRKRERVKEVTPIFDVLNTLQKMAQKRAMVGGVILAVGASDFFTHDFDDIEDANSAGATPEARAITSTIPIVTKVSSEPALHADGTKTYFVKALTTIEEKHLPKEAGFRWDGANKMWVKNISEAEANELPFSVERIG